MVNPADANLTEHVEPQAVGVDACALAEATAFVEAELARTGCPGACLLASRYGKIFIERYWGTCCTQTGPGQPYDGDRINMLYSFSKGLTATVVVMVHQEGLLDYDQAVCEIIPEFAGQGREQITVRHCLTHSAGIPKPELPPAYGPEGWSAAIAAVCRAELEWPPGSRTEYHGTSGMLLAAEAARRLSGAAGSRYPQLRNPPPDRPDRPGAVAQGLAGADRAGEPTWPRSSRGRRLRPADRGP